MSSGKKSAWKRRVREFRNYLLCLVLGGIFLFMGLTQPIYTEENTMEIYADSEKTLMSSQERRLYPIPLLICTDGTEYTFGFSWQVLKSLGTLVTGGLGINDVGGPIYTIGTIANLSSQSWGYFLTLLPLIAANLAVFNWLPIPALDGSKILLTTIEWIIGRPLFKQKTENLIHSIGFFLLLALVFFADFYHIFVAIFR